MAISYVGSVVGNATNGGSITLALPAARATSDLIIAVLGAGDDDFTEPTLAITTAGYTELTTSTISVDGGTAGDANLAVFYKYHNGTDTNIVSTASGTGTDSSTALAVMLFRDVASVAQGGPLEISIQTANGTTGGDPNPPQVSGFTEASSAVVIAGAVGNTSALTLTAPTGYTTNAVNSIGNDNFDISVGLAYKLAPSDPEDPGVFTDNGAGAAWAAVTMVLKATPPIQNYTQTAAITATLSPGILKAGARFTSLASTLTPATKRATSKLKSVPSGDDTARDYYYTFEGGSNGVGLTTSDTGSGTQWTGFNTGSGNSVTYSTTALHGTLSGRYYAAGTNTGAASYWVVGEVDSIYTRIYGRFANSNSLTRIIYFLDSDGPTSLGGARFTTGRVLAMLDDIGTVTGSTFTAVPALNEWFRLETYFKQSTGAWELRLFTGADLESETPTESHSGTGASFTYPTAIFDRVRFGTAGADLELFIDAIAADSSGWIGPLSTSSSWLTVATTKTTRLLSAITETFLVATTRATRLLSAITGTFLAEFTKIYDGVNGTPFTEEVNISATLSPSTIKAVTKTAAISATLAIAFKKATVLAKNIAMSFAGGATPLEFRNAATNSNANQSTIVVDKPTGTVEGDLMVMVVGIFYPERYNLPTFTPPGGWTFEGYADVDDLDEDFNETVDDWWIRVYTKVAGASEPANYTYGATIENGNEIDIAILTYIGAPTGEAMPSEDFGFNYEFGLADTYVSPTVTADAGDLLFYINNDGTTVAPSGMTERVGIGGSPLASAGLFIAEEQRLTAGATGTRTPVSHTYSKLAGSATVHGTGGGAGGVATKKTVTTAKNIAATLTVALTKLGTFVRTISVGVTGTVAMTRLAIYSKLIAVGATLTPVVRNATSKLLAITGTFLAEFDKVYTPAGADHFTEQVNITTTLSPATLKAITKTAAISATLAVAVTRLWIAAKTIAISATLAVGRTNAVRKLVALGATLTPTARKALTKSIALGLTGTVAHLRATVKNIALTLTGAVTFARNWIATKTIAVTATLTPAVKKVVTTTKSIGATLTAAFEKFYQSVAGTPFTELVQVTSTMTVGVTRATRKIIDRTATLTAAISQKASVKSINLATTLSLTVRRVSRKLVALTSTFTPAIAKTAAQRLVIAVSMTATPAVQKATRLLKSLGATLSVVFDFFVPGVHATATCTVTLYHKAKASVEIYHTATATVVNLNKGEGYIDGY